MKEYKLALIGFGNVGQGFTEILTQRDRQAFDHGTVDFKIVAVCDAIKGSLYEPNGLDPVALLKAAEIGNLETVPASYYGWDAFQTIRDTNADVVVEVTYTDLKTGQPAISHVETAFKAQKHVVTTNKGPVALKYAALKELAAANGVVFGVEGTVMSGTPTMLLGMKAIASANVRRIQGIVNGTTNYILTRMAEGNTYASALAEAQKMGYAEADPAGDVEGYDAAGKIVILANLLMDANLTMANVDREGITRLTPQDIEAARAVGEVWKLIGTIEKNNGDIKASVKPTRIPLSHPLASVNGGTNAITFATDFLDNVTLIGPGAGRLAAGYAVLLDLLEINRRCDLG